MKYNLIVAFWFVPGILVVCPFVVLLPFVLFEIITGQRVWGLERLDGRTD